MSKDQTITKTLYLPSDWATDQDPLHAYFQQNLIEHCQNGGKDLRKRAKSILKKSNPEYRKSRIDTIYNKQKYRLWLFFDRLYDKHLDDNHKIDFAYKISLEADSLNYKNKNQHYNHIYSSTIQGILSRDYSKFFKDFLVEQNYLDINHSYNPWYFAYDDNSYPKSYRLTDWVYSDQVRIEKKQIEIPKNNIESFNKKFSYPEPPLPEFVEKLKEHFKEWSITETNIKQIYKNPDYSIHDRINIKSELIDGINLSNKSIDWFKFNISFGQRIYHKNAQIKKEYRKFINHPLMKGKSQSKCLIEHRNCLIYLYSNYILRYTYFEESFFKYKDLVEKLDFNIVKDRSLKGDLIEVFKELIISEGKNFKSKIFKEHFNLSSQEIEQLEKILYCYAEYSNDQDDELGVWAIFIMGKLGIVYDVIYELFSFVNEEAQKLEDFSEELVKESDIKGRKDFKILFNRYLNFPTISINHVPDIKVFNQIFKHLFPTFHKEMMKHKYKSYKNVANVAFKWESKLMVRNVAKELIESEEGVPFYTIHDGIVCYEKDATKIKHLIEEKSRELFDYTSPIEIEAIE